jgi:hypothetical protein
MIMIGIEDEIMIVGIRGMQGVIKVVRGDIEDVVGEGVIVIEMISSVVIISSSCIHKDTSKGGFERLCSLNWSPVSA